jgi:two-component sensor histidine kinase
MSMVHEHLYKAENLADISFRGYIANLAEELFRSYAGYDGRIQLKIDVDPQLSMNLDTAIPCGLIVNELASNALKHAFPQPRGGVLTIGLHRLEDGRYRLRISDDGIGVPEHFDVIKTKTLGFQLVEALVEELHGTMHMKSEGGTGFDLEFRELKYKQRMQREEAV